ncbi:uncharacterized protein PGTG_07304 [Puccinia graminis f. sp. tritici CRL 75-36-700-3]|uniref:Uncharacterized protein n=1 Tax=Puccinia graminis f. sp. tritici (strain CRL 75-36-700-3 / race SCCL) TaxID=418459 RepID=E3K9A2_PUCGT|nr:uncharacterized protein PGTG_07304 [Puccinia graminis f. sp. tritici CRL 75-36-700-3]EFP81052.1 hypothetical protein PGTG_07304 [Puccinia graminis f. sp. tritici CRL 75-36-700-3]
MVISTNDFLSGDLDDPSTQFEGVRDSLPPFPDAHPTRTTPPSTQFQATDPAVILGDPSNNDDNNDDDVLMNDRPAALIGSDLSIDQVCSQLQLKLKLDPEHLNIAHLTSKCTLEARHANTIFAIAAFSQLKCSPAPAAIHVFDERFRDAIDQQPDEWKEDHLAPESTREDPPALEAYRDAVGELLKHQRSNLRTLLLGNILETQRISIKGSVPNRHEMITAIYEDLPPRTAKMTASEIQHQVNTNWAMRIRMSYARLVMVHYYVHKSKKTSQWMEIDERLGVLRGSSIEFQKCHAQLVLDKDNELFSHMKHYNDIPKEEFTVPTLDDVRQAQATAAAALGNRNQEA